MGAASRGELSDISAVLETATAALEEIRNQVPYTRQRVAIALLAQQYFNSSSTGAKCVCRVSCCIYRRLCAVRCLWSYGRRLGRV